MSRPATFRRPAALRRVVEQLEERDVPATLLGGFDTIDATQNNFLTGSPLAPPDTHGTAGPNHILSIVNTSIAWYTKAGVQQQAMALTDFFAPLAVGGQALNVFDPKAIYDPFRNRFVCITLDSDTTTFSRILVAVSQTSDPNGEWNYQAVNTLLTVGGNDYWTDYPGLSLDDTALYFTGNPFATGAGGPIGSRLWIMDKQVYDGGTSAVNVFDPYAGTGAAGGTVQPATMHGVRPAGSTGTYLVSYVRDSGFGGAGANDEAQVIRVDDPLTTPTFTLTRINLGDIDGATGFSQPMPQLGTATLLDGGDSRPYNAAWRNNVLVFANTITPNGGVDAGQATVNVMAVDTSGGVPTLLNQVNVGAEDLGPGTSTSYGSVAINAAGVVGLGFTATSPFIFAGAYFTTVDVNAGTFQVSDTVRAGNAPYPTFTGGNDRWGDYSATVLDPSDDSTFWTFQEYAKDQGGLAGNWGTYTGHFRVQTQYYAVGADAGGGPNVKVYDFGGGLRFSFNAYANSYTGGVRVALADVNGDQTPDIITATGAGGGPNVRVFDGRNLNLLYSFMAYPSQYVGGIFVAAGDLDGDGVPEIVTGADQGGGPNVRVFKLLGGGVIAPAGSFFAYTESFTGGVRVAVGDYNNDGAADIITSPGFGGDAHIIVFDGRSVVANAPKILASFRATGLPSGYGAYVSAGNLNGDGVLDFVVGSGGGTREARVYDGRTLAFLNGFTVTQPGGTPQPVNTAPPVGGLLLNVGLPNQLPTDDTQVNPRPVSPTGPFAGLRVAVADIDVDGNDDILAIGGPGDGPLLRIRNGKSMTTLGSDRNVFPASFTGGGFVAAAR